MKIKEELNDLINRLHEDGVKVYAHVWNDNKEITYVHFVKDNRIGYAQYDRFTGFSFTSCHKPNKVTGTGFQVEGNSIEDYKKSFFAPPWAINKYSPKWRSWEDFISHQHFNNYVEV